jgi:hypothetical protein
MVWRSENTTPRIFNFGTRYRWVASFTPRSPYPHRKSPQFTLHENVGGPQGFFFWEKAHLISPLGFKPRFLIRFVHTLVSPIIIIILSDNILDWLISLVRHSIILSKNVTTIYNITLTYSFVWVKIWYLILSNEVRSVWKSEEWIPS